MRAYLPPLAVLAAILVFSLWNSRSMSDITARLQARLETADALAGDGDWSGAADALEDAYRDWSRQQTYLHIVTEHEAVDDAEAMYRWAAVYADARELTEFRAELADLMDQLRLLAEMERLSIKNIL